MIAVYVGTRQLQRLCKHVICAVIRYIHEIISIDSDSYISIFPTDNDFTDAAVCFPVSLDQFSEA